MSSATRTERTAPATGHAKDPGREPGADALPFFSPAMTWGLGILTLAIGWGAILYVYNWHVTPAVVFLFMGWLAILLTARFLWRAGLSAAVDTGAAIDDDEFWRPVGPRDELLREKRSLLKAIKEIEFDHQMGKMSAEDAAQLTRFYRQRAIEIIKVLETDGAGLERLSVQEQIEREVKARLAVSRPGKAQAPAKAQASAEAQAQAPVDAEDKGAQASSEAAEVAVEVAADRVEAAQAGDNASASDNDSKASATDQGETRKAENRAAQAGKGQKRGKRSKNQRQAGADKASKKTSTEVGS